MALFRLAIRAAFFTVCTWCICIVGSVARAQSCDWQEAQLTMGGTSTQTALVVDSASNVFVASIVSGRLEVKAISPSTTQNVPLATDDLAQSDPAFSASALGLTYLVFVQVSNEGTGFGGEILLTSNLGGSFVAPVNLSDNRLDDYAPKIVLDRDGAPHLAWAQSTDASSRVMYWNEGLSEPKEVVSDGDFPSLFVDSNDVVHVAYVQGNDLHYINNSLGVFAGKVAVTSSAGTSESPASLAVVPNGTVYVTFESGNDLLSSESSGGAFGVPQPLHLGGVVDPRMRVRSSGELILTHVKDDDVYYILEQASPFGTPLRVTETAGSESSPSMDMDRSGGLHVSYLRGGDVYYSNNSCAPGAVFSVDVSSGGVPLTVNFIDQSTGGVVEWEWEFGDGEFSTAQNPAHTYASPGNYTAKLTVRTAGGLTDSTTRTIVAQESDYSMSMPNHGVLPGQQDVWFPIIASIAEDIEGFSTLAFYDPAFLQLDAVNIDTGTAFELANVAPDLVITNDLGTFVEVGVLMEVTQPFEGKVLPAGNYQQLMFLVFDVEPSAPVGGTTQVVLSDDEQQSDVTNIFIVDGLNKNPALRSSNVRILSPDPAPELFLRGEVNGDGVIDITDAINILNYLFSGSFSPDCLDPLDVDDGGVVDISDAIRLLSYLFTGGALPSTPFPRVGYDANLDALGDCL